MVNILYCIPMRPLDTYWKKNKMIVLTESTFDEALKNKYVLADFYSEGCPPCRVMNRNLVAFEKRIISPDKIVFSKIDSDAEESLSDKYRIENFPTVILFKNGTEVGRFEGCKKRSEVEKFLKEHMSSGS